MTGVQTCALPISFQPILYKFTVLGSLGLNPFIFWTKEPKPALTIVVVYGEGLSFSEFDVPPWRDQGRTGRSLLASGVKISSSTLSE